MSSNRHALSVPDATVMSVSNRFCGASHAVRGAVLKRVIDDHAFTVEIPGTVGPNACRLQMFVEAGHRPVVLATQALSEPTGQSLTNGAEAFAQEAWRTHMSANAEPPMWIEHYEGGLDGGSDDWMEVTFSHDVGFHLSGPQWRCTSKAEVETIVGMPLESGRGDRYRPPEPEERRRLRFRFVRVFNLPAPAPFRAPDCMPATRGWLSRLRRQVLPVRGTSAECCWYHGGDWHDVTQLLDAEIRRVNAGRLLLEEDDLWEVMGGIRERTLEGSWLQGAAQGVLLDPIRANRTGWVNGQHRAQAMIDAGVRWALLEVS
jgi:hypothetical protein